MAAPSSTVWGSTVGSYCRLGINITLTETETTVKRVTDIWFWSKYGLTDNNNTFYYNDNATSATTSKGSLSISTSVSSGDGWSTSNQVKIESYTYTFNKGTSASTRSVAAKLADIDKAGGTMSVTAKYTIPALDSYKVSYNANGGSGAPSAQTKYYGQTLTLSSTKPTRSGYTFVGWGTTASDTSSNYSAGSSYTSNSAITLYAIWKKTITLSYGANGGSGAPDSQSATVYNATTSYKFTLSSTKPTRTGYNFLGWSTSSTATSASYSSGGTITLSSSDTLYAVWQKITYTVSFNANGGSGAPSSQTKTYGTTLVLSSTKPVKKGYTFLGWSTSSTATSATYSAGGNYTSNSAATLYAVWSENYLILNYYSNGATSCAYEDKLNTPSANSNVLIHVQKYYYDNNYPAGLLNYSTSGSTLYMTRTGFDAAGYYGTSTNGGILLQEDELFTDGQALAKIFGLNLETGCASVTIFPQWKLKTYTITYNANGGTGAPASAIKDYGTPRAISSTVPTRTGYTFLGWGTSSSDTTVDYTLSSNYTANADITLYAIWQVNTYTVTYNANSGSNAPSSQSYTYSSSATITLSSSVPTRTGYTFKNWNTKSDGSGTSYSPGATFNRSNTSTTLYAQWTVNTYTLSYNANGGSGAPSSQSYTYASSGTITISSTKPTRTGYTFASWNTKADGSGTKYSPGGTFNRSNSSTTLYAQWTINSYYLDIKGTIDGVVYDNLANLGTVDVYINGSLTKSDVTDYYVQHEYGTTYEIKDIKGDAAHYYYGVSSGTKSGTINGNKTVVFEFKTRTYDIVYNLNGGSGSVSDQTKTHGVNLTLRTTVPTRSGYKFLGWGTSSTATTATYQPGATFTGNKDTTLYAVWERLGISHINVNGTWKKGRTYVNDNGTWKTGLVFINVNGVWKQGGV